jgi:hypothetical protein
MKVMIKRIFLFRFKKISRVQTRQKISIVLRTEVKWQ